MKKRSMTCRGGCRTFCPNPATYLLYFTSCLLFLFSFVFYFFSLYFA